MTQVLLDQVPNVLVIKEEKQTDGSCDRMTDVTDVTDDEDRKSKKKIRRELSTEFIVFVGPEKRKMKLVAVSDTDSGFTQSEDNTNEESEGDKTGAQSNEEPSAKSSGELISDQSTEKYGESGRDSKSDPSTDNSGESCRDSNLDVSTDKLGESGGDSSVQEVDQPPKLFETYEIDSSESDNTDNMYKGFMEGSKISVHTLSTLSTVGFTESDKSVEVVKNVGMSSTVAYSDSSVEILSDR